MIDDRSSYTSYSRTDTRGPRMEMSAGGRVVKKTATNDWRKMVSNAKSGGQGVNPIFSVSANANRRSRVVMKA
jgi:hypothetical protein